MTWEYEANNPVDWSPYFSPIVVEDSQHVVYVGGRDVERLYKYNLDIDAWTRLADPPTDIRCGVSMSPDGTKLAFGRYDSNLLHIYDIGGDSWTTSAAPNMSIDGGAAIQYVCATVWSDDDTIWCQVRANIGGYKVKCYRYVVSTDTWTQFTNYATPATSDGYSMSINSAGTALFVGKCGANISTGLKYVIATDTYSYFTITSGFRFCHTMYRAAKLWYFDTLTSHLGTRYYDCDAETNPEITIFPWNSDRGSYAMTPCGVYGSTYIIGHYKPSEPKNMSYRVITTPSVTTDPATEVT